MVDSTEIKEMAEQNPMMRPVLVLAQWLDGMLEELDAHKDKGGWEGCTAQYLLQKMFDHMDAGRVGIENGASTKYVREKFLAASNYAMMISDNYSREHEATGEYKTRNEKGEWIS